MIKGSVERIENVRRKIAAAAVGRGEKSRACKKEREIEPTIRLR
jgi:hypothetical protein